MDIPILCFAGFSGSGKTTLLEKLIPLLRARGLRLAVIKHDGHQFDIDHEGRDSARLAAAGAEQVLLTSRHQTAVMEQRALSLDEVLCAVHDVDLVLVEGFKQAPFTQIGVCRAVNTEGFPGPLERYAAVVTDLPPQAVPAAWFGLNEAERLADFIMENKKNFTHFNGEGRAYMVSVEEKPATHRTAVAAARVCVNPETFQLIQTGGIQKGDVLTVAQIAGILGAKHTPDLIPMCHPVLLTGTDLSIIPDAAACAIEIRATATCDGKTGVEMEALTAAAVAALTVYDMCKAVQRDIVISDIRLLEKTGGIHGDFHREEQPIPEV